MRKDGQPQSTIEPGQIWLIEQVSDAAICSLDRPALTGANIIVYDAALAPLVARILPLGGYAEPLSHAAQEAGAAISRRALDFAAAGWSVVQLVEAHPGCRQRLRDAVAALRPISNADMPVRVIAKGVAADRPASRDSCMRSVPQVIDQFAEDPLTLVFGPLVCRHPAARQVFTANGLAG